MPRWIKFVAFFMFAFLLFDVCAPEACESQTFAPASIQTQVSGHQSSGAGEGCQFEEDCFNCAHFAPGATFTLEPIAVVAFADTTLLVSSLDGTPLIPYHPPRV